MGEIVVVSVESGVAEVMLNRPKRKNALSLEMFEALAETGHSLKSHPELRAVIVHGAEGDFCAGLDMEVMTSQSLTLGNMREKLKTPLDGSLANWFQKPCTVWSELSVPVIAAIEGVCLGGGLQLALGADIRVSAPNARLSIMEAKWGLVPDMGISQSLPKLMSADRAKDLMWRADIISGAEAQSEGLVTKLDSAPLEHARDLAQRYAKRSPEALSGIKRLVDENWVMAPGEGLRIEADIQAPILGSPNQLEAVAANVQKRSPNFK